MAEQTKAIGERMLDNIANDEPQTVQLITALMGANYDQMTGTMNSLLRNAQAQLRAMAADYAVLYDALERIPPMTRSVYIEEWLQHGGFAREKAAKILDKEED